MDWVKQPVPEAIVGHHKSQVNVTMLKAARQAQSSVFHEMHLDTAMTQLVVPRNTRAYSITIGVAPTRKFQWPALQGARPCLNKSASIRR